VNSYLGSKLSSFGDFVLSSTVTATRLMPTSIKPGKFLAKLLLEHQHATGGCTGYKSILKATGKQLADVLILESIHTFGRQSRLYNDRCRR